MVGSIPRGEYIHKSSDINIFVITEFDSSAASLNDLDPRLNVLLFGEKEFMDERSKKYRFICWSDGVVLYGKQFKFDNKEFPKPGTFLALLLNRTFIDDLTKIKDEVAKLKNPTEETLHYYSVKIAKIMLNFGFGVAIGNKPFFTSSMKERVQYIRKIFPEQDKSTLNMERAYHGGHIKQADFPTIIDSFIETEKPAFGKMLAIEENILKENGKKND